MAVPPAGRAINTQDITDKARRDLLHLLEAVCNSPSRLDLPPTNSDMQVRGKKNLVIERSLAGTIGLFVKFSTLQEYGVDKLFFLENHNVDSTQRNLVFLVRGENAKAIRTVAGMCYMSYFFCPIQFLRSNASGILKRVLRHTSYPLYSNQVPISTYFEIKQTSLARFCFPPS